MLIPNPWPRILTRITSRPGDIVTVMCVRGDIELDDSTTQAVIEPIKDRGRGHYDVLCQGKIWSKEWGIMELEDHEKKCDLIEQEKKLELKKEKEAKRKSKEAKERGKVVKNNPSKEEVEAGSH